MLGSHGLRSCLTACHINGGLERALPPLPPQALYEAVRTDRNLYSKNLIEAQDEINELKRKFKIQAHQVGGGDARQPSWRLWSGAWGRHARTGTPACGGRLRMPVALQRCPLSQCGSRTLLCVPCARRSSS